MITRSTAFSGTSCVIHRKTCWKIADFLGEIPTGFLQIGNEKDQTVIRFCESDVQSGQVNGTPGGIRTHGLPLRSWGDRLFSKFREGLRSARKAYFLTVAADALFREVPRKFVKIRENHTKIRQRLDNV